MLARVIRLIALAAAVAAFAGSAGAASAGHGDKHWKQSGKASWYGPGLQGKRTTSGQVFNQNAMTAAHTTLPLGTKVRVTRKKTGKSVVVTINDRLPRKKSRIIDLSKGAARRLGIVNQGLATVTIVPVTSSGAEEVAEAPN